MFGGLGIDVRMQNGGVKVVSAIPNAPAAKAGVQADDFITHLDDDATQGMTLDQAVDKMRGPVNTRIRLNQPGQTGRPGRPAGEGITGGTARGPSRPGHEAPSLSASSSSQSDRRS